MTAAEQKTFGKAATSFTTYIRATATGKLLKCGLPLHIHLTGFQDIILAVHIHALRSVSAECLSSTVALAKR